MQVEKPVRICFPFVGDSVGGSHLSAVTLIQSLDLKQFEPLVAIAAKGPLSQFLEEKKISFTYLPSPLQKFTAEKSLIKQLLHVLQVVPSLVRFAREQKIALVHTNDLRMHLAWSLAAPFSKIKQLWHQRTVNDSRRNTWLSSFATIVTISQYCLQSLPPKIRHKAKVIYNPISSSFSFELKEREREKTFKTLSLPLSVKLVGYVGNFESHKRAQVFLQMAALLIKGKIPVKFLMIGRDSKSILPKIRELGLEESVLLLDFTQPIEPWIFSLDVLVAPGVREGFGRTVVEAMLLKTPVVASKHGGHVEIIEEGKNGFLAEMDNAENFALKVNEIFQCKNISEIVEEAYLGAKKLYSVEKHTEQMSILYKQMVNLNPI